MSSRPTRIRHPLLLLADGLLARTMDLGMLLVLPVSLLLFLQWPLRDLVQAYSREANDLAQVAFALYVSLALTQATRRGSHLATDALAHRLPQTIRRRIARFAPPLVLIPWALFILASSAASVWQSALLTVAFIAGLLGGVVAGRLYAVEAAATGGVLLFVYGLLSGHLTRDALRAVLRDTMSISGSLFALLIGATTFSLVLRTYETDRWITTLLSGMAGGEFMVLAVVLGGLAACSFVLDAFEIIFVVLPVVMPPLLMRVPDATWVAVLTLLILQTSFLVPPFGYAILMVRIHQARFLANQALMVALLPYLLAQFVVLAAVCVFPSMVSRSAPDAPPESPVEGSILAPAEDDSALADLLRRQQELQNKPADKP